MEDIASGKKEINGIGGRRCINKNLVLLFDSFLIFKI